MIPDYDQRLEDEPGFKLFQTVKGLEHPDTKITPTQTPVMEMFAKQPGVSKVEKYRNQQEGDGGTTS